MNNSLAPDTYQMRSHLLGQKNRDNQPDAEDGGDDVAGQSQNEESGS
jgi:hypothetical protein